VQQAIEHRAHALQLDPLDMIEGGEKVGVRFSSTLWPREMLKNGIPLFWLMYFVKRATRKLAEARLNGQRCR
jgi:hypothetical protein